MTELEDLILTKCRKRWNGLDYKGRLDLLRFLDLTENDGFPLEAYEKNFDKLKSVTRQAMLQDERDYYWGMASDEADWGAVVNEE